MGLIPHIAIHFLLSLLAGFLVWKRRRNVLLSFSGAFLGGVAVDFDHLIDYFLAFGFDFHIQTFLSGYQFLKSDKIYVLFHAWEYVIIFVIMALFLKNRAVNILLFSLALGLFFHLGADCLLNEGMRPQAYLVTNRVKNNFDVKSLVSPNHYQKHLRQKESVRFE